MRFFRSSESRAKSKSRFSFRRHSDDAADDEPKAPAKPRLRATAELPPAAAAAAAKAASDSLSSTFVSSLSISTASSVSSPASLPRDSALQQRSSTEDDSNSTTASAAATTTTTGNTTTLLKRTSDSNASTEPDDDGDAAWPLGTPCSAQLEPQPTHRRTSSTQSLATPRDSFRQSMRSHSASSSSSSSTTTTSTAAAPRHSIVGYRQLRCSMSYKNRMGVQNDDSLTSLPAPLVISHRGDHAGRSSSSAGSASSLSGSFINSHQHHHQSSHSTAAAPASASTAHAASSPMDQSHLMPRGSEVRLTEVSVAALQTRRAFQQMVLAIEDDESSEYDSDSEGFVRASTDSFVGSGGIVQLGMDEYRKFQFRLRQLEDMCQEQARKQANMEETIEQEVQARTKKVVEATEKKIAMYKQAKDIEVEREIQRRVSEMAGLSRQSSVPNMSTRDTVTTLPPQYPELKNKPLDKILHPRRTRRRLELLREREEQQKREMEQFREFIRNTETRIPRSPTAAVSDSARASIKALRDPHITEDLLNATHNELIEMICMLRQHVGVQEQQLDEAKKLITAAIEAREEAEETAREAVELTMELDSRLERASQEIVVIRDELRRSSEFSMRSSGLDRTSSTLSLRATQNSGNGSFVVSNSI